MVLYANLATAFILFAKPITDCLYQARTYVTGRLLQELLKGLFYPHHLVRHKLDNGMPVISFKHISVGPALEVSEV